MGDREEGWLGEVGGKAGVRYSDYKIENERGGECVLCHALTISLQFPLLCLHKLLWESLSEVT